jgi:ribose transport system permease protein
MAMSGIIVIILINSGMDMGLAIVIAVLSGSLVGFVNGFLIVHQKTEAFIITLGMGMLIQGVALLLTNAVNVSARNPNFQRIANDNLLGIPNIAAIMIVLGILTFLLLRFTSFGRNIYALGGDYEVAEHSGINVVFTKWMAFVLTGTFAAIAGVLAASRMNTGIPIVGVEIPLMVNCGVVLGGTSFAGGVGGVTRSFIGIFLLFLLSNSLGMLGFSPFNQQMVRGFLIVSIISLDCWAIKRKREAV